MWRCFWTGVRFPSPPPFKSTHFYKKVLVPIGKRGLFYLFFSIYHLQTILFFAQLGYRKTDPEDPHPEAFFAGFRAQEGN